MKKMILLSLLLGILSIANTENTVTKVNKSNEIEAAEKSAGKSDESINESPDGEAAEKTAEEVNEKPDVAADKEAAKDEAKEEAKPEIKIPRFEITIEGINVDEKFSDSLVEKKDEEWMKNRKLEKIVLTCEEDSCKVLEKKEGTEAAEEVKIEKKLTAEEKEKLMEAVEVVKESREDRIVEKPVAKTAKNTGKKNTKAKAKPEPAAEEKAEALKKEEYREGIFVYFNDGKVDEKKTERLKKFPSELVDVFNFLEYKNKLIRDYSKIMTDDYRNFKYISRLVYGDNGNSYGTIFFCNGLECEIKKEKDGIINEDKNIAITLTEKEKKEIVVRLVESIQNARPANKIAKYYPSSTLTLNTKKVYAMDSDNAEFTDIMTNLYKVKKVPKCKIGFFQNTCK